MIIIKNEHSHCIGLIFYIANVYYWQTWGTAGIADTLMDAKFDAVTAQLATQPRKNSFLT